ncbi:MAG: CinA family nicotinamide mononucleotide deamidase-related protein, partial [Saprospiraceae bacterium]|nr:CinA family nicotinamide mononucleotide deamidase-related protein [Saprospiraceae bacterium]
GLGPTKDDITKKTLAGMFNSGMSFHPETFDRIAAYFEKIGRVVPPAMRDQATLPDVAEILTNKVGTAPGMWFERDGKVLVSLPGVPFEMEHLMTHEVLPRIKKRFTSRPIIHRTLQTAGEGESNIAKRIESFEDSLPPYIKLAYLPSLGQVRLRLTAIWPGAVTADAETVLNAELDQKADELQAIIPELVFGRENETLQETVGKTMRSRGLTLGIAESCTGGYLSHLITSVPGASDYFMGAMVTYSNELKIEKLGVDPSMIEQHGAVSEVTVCAMAEGALKTLGVDIAVAITGIAGPGGGTPEKPVGTVWMAVSGMGHTSTVKHIFGRDRVKNIHMASIYALILLRRFLTEV